MCLRVHCSVRRRLWHGINARFLCPGAKFLKTGASDPALSPACCAGGYKQHDDHENDAHVQEVAKFAVQQVRLLFKVLEFKCGISLRSRLKQTAAQAGEKKGTKLELLKVLSAHTQVLLPRSSPAVWQHGRQEGESLLAPDSGQDRCAAAQVVAGTNYKLLLSVADASNQKKNLEVTVYGAQRPLLSSSLRRPVGPLICGKRANCLDMSTRVC